MSLSFDPRAWKASHWGGVVAAVVATVVAWRAYDSIYATPRDALQARITAAQSGIEKLQDELDRGVTVNDELRRLAATTLGKDLGLVAHRFRAGVTRVAESAGLARVVVDQGQPTAERNPLINVANQPEALKRLLRGSTDFQVIRGSLRGSGDLASCLRTLASLHVQPWIHRVEGFSLEPAGRERAYFELRVDLATLYMPDLATDAVEPELVPIPEGVEPVYMAIAERNVFRRPPPPTPDAPQAPVQVARASDPAPPPAAAVFPAYEEWRLTGIFVGGRGPEAFLVNTRSGQRLTVEKGARVLDAIFVEGDGETAVFELDGRRFEVTNGETLASRRPRG